MASIFLSYGRADDEPFVKRLYQYLTEKGFNVWYDRVSMPSRALTFLHEIRDAIHTSERVVVVLGPHALGSDYVRAEWQHALAEAKVVVPVLRLGTYREVPPELRDLHCPDCTVTRSEPDGFSEIERILSDPIPPLAIISGDLPDIPAHFQPRPAAMTSIAHEVLLDLESPVLISGPERVVFVHGMGGTGKSVLAAAFARSTTTRRSFADGVVWLSASPEMEPLDLLRRCGQLISGAPQSYANESTATTELRKLLAERRVLLVLDNIWNVEQVEHLLGSLDVNTRVLVTARDAGLASALGARAVEIRELSEDAALQQLADWVHLAVDKLPAVAADLARECGYLPFALALNGAMLADKIDWNDLIAALRAAELDYADKRLANYPYPTVLKSIKVSIDALQATNPEALARYRELAAFDLQFGVPEAAVLMLWEHLGSTSDRNARKILSALTSKALLRMTGESPNRTVLLHDLLIDYLHATGDDPKKLNSELLEAYRKKCANGWSSGPNDRYFHRHLTEHLARADRVDEIHELLAAESGKENAWYAANDAIGNIDGYLSDVSRAMRLEQSGKFNDRDAMRRQLGFQMRYALIGGSIRSLASTIPDEVRTALVRNGIWSGARGLVEANQIAEASRRVRALVELIPCLDESLRSRAIDDALRSARMCGKHDIPRLLGRIVPLLDPAVRQPILDEALETASSIDSPGYRATALAGLVPVISPDRKEALINQTLLAMTLEVTTAGVNQGGFDAFSSLARYVEGVTMEALIVLLRLIPNEFMRARAYALTVGHVPKDLREAFAREGLELVSPDDRGAVGIYVALALHLPETSEAELFDEVVRKDTRQIHFLLSLLPQEMDESEVDAWMSRLEGVPFGREIERFEAYAEMLARLPEARREALVAQLAVSAASLEFDSWRTQAYETLAPYLSREQVLAAKKVLNQIGDSSKVASAWVELMDHLDHEARHRLCDFVLEHVKASSYLDVLVRLASHVEGADRDRVLAVAFDAFRKGASMSGGMMSGNIVEETLALFAKLAPPAWRNEILNAALNNIFHVPRGPYWGARGFVHLIPQLPADIVDRGARVLLSDAARDAVEQVTTSISGETKGSQTVVAEVIETLAEFLSDEVRAEAFELAKQIQDRGWRMGALLSLAAGMPEPQRTEIINEAIVTQESLDLNAADPETNYWRPLLALANLIEDADLKRKILSRALTAARALDRSWRPRALIEIGKKLEPTDRAEVMMEVVPLNHAYYAHEMAPALTPDEAREVLGSSILDAVRHHEGSRGEAASAFIDTQSREAQYDLWMQAHTILNEHPRATLASRLPAIAPLMRSLAGPDVIQDATHTLLQVNRWWP